MTPLASLLAPLTLSEFLSTYYQRAPLVAPGDPARGVGLVSRERVIEAAAAGPGARRGSILMQAHRLPPEFQTPAIFAGNTVRAALPVAVVQDYVERGYPVVWNAARGASPALDALVDGLAREMGAHTWPNIYMTGGSATPLDFHFDAHEVLAIQCEGRKEWRVSKVRVDRPLDLPALMPRIRETIAAQRAAVHRAIAGRRTVLSLEP